MEAETKEAIKVESKRFGLWWLISVLALVGVLWKAPQQGEVLLYKLAQVTVGLLLAYFADKALFHYAPQVDPEMPRDVLSAGRLIARALIAIAVILGLTIGI